MDYHLVPNVVDYSTLLANGTLLTTLANEILKITVGDGRLFVDSAEIVVPNVLIQEGILHIIDKYEKIRFDLLSIPLTEQLAYLTR